MHEIKDMQIIKEAENKCLESLKKLKDYSDTEVAHMFADDALCLFLKEIGMDDIVIEYDKIDKWYA